MEVKRNVLSIAEHSSYFSQYFEQVPPLTTTHRNKKFLWPKLRIAHIYRHKYLEESIETLKHIFKEEFGQSYLILVNNAIPRKYIYK